MRHLIGIRGQSVTDVVPDAVNWENVGFNDAITLWTYTEKRITGINTAITLKVEYNNLQGDLYYLVGNSQLGNDGLSALNPSELGMQLLSPNGTFTVFNNQWISFGANSSETASPWVTVKNVSSGDTVIDTFGVFFLS